MKNLSLETIDTNFHIAPAVTDSDVVWHDVRQDPFRVYGLYDYKNQSQFIRMPAEVAERVSPSVAHLCRNTAGGRVRFATDSDLIAIHALMPTVCRLPHMALSGSAGFDLYVDDPTTGTSRFWRSFVPSVHMQDGYESEVRFPSRKLRYVTIHFPLYSDVETLLIGTHAGAVLTEGLPYRQELPIVYYGSSITQGGCASRPGNAYQNIVSRRLGFDHINLGFSGSGKAEDAMIEYLATLPMCAFVSDYDHNAPNAAHLKETHEKLYRAIRQAHPTVPYIILSKCDLDRTYTENIERREVIFETYRRGWNEGDRNLYYIDGPSIFRGLDGDACTVDGTHPNDYGFQLLANAVTAELLRAFTQDAFL